MVGGYCPERWQEEGAGIRRLANGGASFVPTAGATFATLATTKTTLALVRAYMIATTMRHGSTIAAVARHKPRWLRASALAPCFQWCCLCTAPPFIFSKRPF